MEKDKREGTFIPCGDAFEKMCEIGKEAMECSSAKTSDKQKKPEQ